MTAHLALAHNRSLPALLPHDSAYATAKRRMCYDNYSVLPSVIARSLWKVIRHISYHVYFPLLVAPSFRVSNCRKIWAGHRQRWVVKNSQFSAKEDRHITEQVTWLASPKSEAQVHVCLPVRGARGKCYYNILLYCDYVSSLSVVSQPFSALGVYSKFRHHPHRLVPNVVLSRPPWLS